MAISATFYKNNKRVNSTKLPIAQAGTIGMSIELKDVTNLFTPSLVISADRFKSNDKIINPMQYNYCYIADFGRYYFIRSWSWILGRWECSLEIDVLASFRTAIGNTTAYVLRSASNCDPSIVDSKYPAVSGVSVAATAKNSRWDTDINSTSITQGFYVIGVINNDANAVGVTSYYVLSGSGMREFIQKLYASPNWMNITDTGISTDLQKMLMNPIQYITSCMWFPFGIDPTTLAQRGGTIPVGWWSISMTNTVYWLTGSTMKQTQYETFDIPTHPQATGNFAWLKNAPYSQYQLQFYPFGVFAIDSAKLIGYNRIYCKMDIDLMTGSAILTATRAYGNTQYTSDILYSCVGQVGIPISLAQMSVDMSRLANSTTWALSAGLALVNNKPFMEDVKSVVDTASNIGKSLGDVSLTNLDAIKGFGSEIGNTFKAAGQAGLTLLSTIVPTAADTANAVLSSSGVCETQGSNGSLAQFELQHILTCFYYNIVSADPVHYGYPLCQNKKINTLSGFILCANEGDLTITATPTERQAVIAMMKAGFYYE